MIALEAGAWTAEVRPSSGGAIAALRFEGVDLLRPMPAESADPLQSGCFPLVPYCNRIHNGRFAFAGRVIALPANFPPEPHSLHGFGWQRAWAVESQAESKCVLVHEYDADWGWPWAYRAPQRIRMGPKGCAVTLVLTNRSDDPMPAGIGLHPYFRRRTETELSFKAEQVLLTGTDPLPTGISAPADHFAAFGIGAMLPAQTLDHCFTGWDGRAVVRDSHGTIALSADGAPHLHLYAPADGSALCLEPVSHKPDALNRAREEMIILPPACAASLTMRIGAS